MKCPFHSRLFLLLLPSLVILAHEAMASQAFRPTIEARVSNGLWILMALGFLYGSWRLMGIGRRE